MLVAVLAALLGAAVAALVAVVLAYQRSRGRLGDANALIEEAGRRLRAEIDEGTSAHTEEIRRVLARERAQNASEIAAEERRLNEERRAVFAERERVATAGFLESLSAVERRLEERLRGFTDDLDRGQRHFEQQIQALEQRCKQALGEVMHRIEAEAVELGSTADEQRRVVLRLREELERAAGQAVTEALDELEAHTVERRRAVEEITERLRTREAAIADAIEKTETDVRARIDVMLVEWERRQSERLDRITEREIERHVQVASQAFDERLREIREQAVTSLSRELDRTVDLLAREGLAVLVAPGGAHSTRDRVDRASSD
ncbi:MAG: hypothetical protein FJW96_04685 [Actinobacteria bacterium]|nr:hypothetical protein [Actinomycetota bacterium]